VTTWYLDGAEFDPDLGPSGWTRIPHPDVSLIGKVGSGEAAKPAHTCFQHRDQLSGIRAVTDGSGAASSTGVRCRPDSLSLSVGQQPFRRLC
jgi:hypothetical protein